MPEGPSIVIAREEMEAAIGKKVLKVAGNSKEPIFALKNQSLKEIGHWGKHLLLFFSDDVIKIHFMLWGSYSVGKAKPERKPRLQLNFKNTKIFFYACSVKFLDADVEEIYDWSADIMSPSWDEQKAIEKINKQPDEMVCDVLMDQSIFAGVGNIIKNEVLFILRMLPQTKVSALTAAKIKKLVQETHSYTWKFYDWKKKYELKKHWQIMRKKTCPVCGGPVTRKETGVRERLSHYCTHCQK